MAVGRNGAPYGSSGSTRNPGGPSSPGRVGPSTGGPAGGGPASTNPISGGGGHDEFNIRLLLSCAIGGAVGTALAMLLIRQLYESIPNIILYGIVMAVISLGVLLGAVTTTNMYGESFPKTIAVAILGTAIMFAAAALFEFVYEIKIQPKQKEEPVVEQVVFIPVDYIFCIDDSSSMGRNDPQNLRDSALADLLDQISPTSRVGILRYNTGLKSEESVGLAPLDENQKQLLRGVLQNHKSGGDTNFVAPLQVALDELALHLGTIGVFAHVNAVQEVQVGTLEEGGFGRRADVAGLVHRLLRDDQVAGDEIGDGVDGDRVGNGTDAQRIAAERGQFRIAVQARFQAVERLPDAELERGPEQAEILPRNGFRHRNQFVRGHLAGGDGTDFFRGQLGHFRRDFGEVPVIGGDGRDLAVDFRNDPL